MPQGSPPGRQRQWQPARHTTAGPSPQALGQSPPSAGRARKQPRQVAMNHLPPSPAQRVQHQQQQQLHTPSPVRSPVRAPVSVPSPSSRPRDDRAELHAALQGVASQTQQSRYDRGRYDRERAAEPEPEPARSAAQFAELEIALVEKDAELAAVRKIFATEVGRVMGEIRTIKSANAHVRNMVTGMATDISNVVPHVEQTLAAELGGHMDDHAVHHHEQGKYALRAEISAERARILELEAAAFKLESELAAREGDLAAKAEALVQEQEKTRRLQAEKAQLLQGRSADKASHSNAMAAKEAQLVQLRASVSGEVLHVLSELRDLKTGATYPPGSPQRQPAAAAEAAAPGTPMRSRPPVKSPETLLAEALGAQNAALQRQMRDLQAQVSEVQQNQLQASTAVPPVPKAAADSELVPVAAAQPAEG